MSRPLLRALLGAGAFLTAACADTDTTSAPGMAIRDSAGVRIVEYAGAPTSARAVSLAPDPTYRHGDQPGEYGFAGIALGALLPDGGAVIVDGNDPRAGQGVLLFGPDGRFRTIIARSGEGPVDIGQVVSVTVIGSDSLLLDDRASGKLMLFEDTALVRSSSTLERPTLRTMRVQGADASGRPLLTTSVYRNDFTEPWLHGHMVRLDLATLRADTVASYEMVASQTPGAPRNPFPARGFTVASGGRFVYARTDVPELVWRDAGGALQQILRWSAEPRRTTEADERIFLESFAEDVRRMNANAPPEALEQLVAEQLAMVEFPLDVPLPLYRSIWGDGRGGVWLGEFLSAARVSFQPRYTVIAGDGTWLGTVEMPERFRVLDVSGDRVLGVLVDSVGVESVAVFEVRGR